MLSHCTSFTFCGTVNIEQSYDRLELQVEDGGIVVRTSVRRRCGVRDGGDGEPLDPTLTNPHMRRWTRRDVALDQCFPSQ